MKRILLLITFLGFAATALCAQETLSLAGSNQNQTTLGFELNEYDYLINPLYLGRLVDPWLFFALDDDVNQLGADIAGNGLRAGWAPGGEMTPVFLADYLTDMDTLERVDPEENVEITRTGYDIATGQYATIVEAVSEDIKREREIHDLVLHGGLSLTDMIGLAVQLGVAIDRWTIESVDYTNTYTDTAAISDASLTTRGPLTEIVVNMHDETENSYQLDVEVGLTTKDIRSRIVLGTGWYYPHTRNNSYTETVTVYNAGGGLDDTIRDQETITSYTGQYTTGGGLPAAGFTMTSPVVDAAEYFGVGVYSETMLPIGEVAELTIPFGVGMDIHPRSLQTVESTTIVTYDDASATSLETSRSTTTTTTSLVRTQDLSATAGAEIGKSVIPTENTGLHLGAGLDIVFESAKDVKTQTGQQLLQQDNDGDGAYTTAGTDVDYTYTESGYEVQRTQFEYAGILQVKSAVSFTPVPVLTFHAGASAGLRVRLTSTSSLTTGDAAFVFEQYTDNLDDANSYAIRQKDGSANDSIPDSSRETDFTPFTDAAFGFTLAFSDNFKIDARSVYSGNVGFAEFSVLGMYSY
jgi:hypothetical protein